MPEFDKLQEVNALMGEKPLVENFGINLNEALGETQAEEVKEERKCAVCGSTDIYKYTTRPLCAKCAGMVEKPKRVPYVRAEKKLGRNDICSCGSGKKFKKCCYGSNI